MVKRMTGVLVATALFVTLSGCTGAPEQNGSAQTTQETSAVAEATDGVVQEDATQPGDIEEVQMPETAQDTTTDGQASVEDERGSELRMAIGEREVTVAWEDNESTEALRDLCCASPLVIEMSPYGGFEQVGPIGQSLPANDVETETAAGDIVLYSSNQIVVFYGSNTWAYTRLGHIIDPDAAGLAELLGHEGVTLTISGKDA